MQDAYSFSQFLMEYFALFNRRNIRRSCQNITKSEKKLQLKKSDFNVCDLNIKQKCSIHK